MTIDEQDRKNLMACCLGNAEAVEFLTLWSQYVNLVDDIIDEDLPAVLDMAWMDHGRTIDADTVQACAVTHARSNVKRIQRGAARVCGMGALAIQLYSHPFYLKNLAALRQIAFNCTNAYLDSVNFENSGEEWKEQWADHYRHFGSEMVIAVAGIVGGWEQARKVSEMLRTICWNSHHGPGGERN